MIFYRIQPPGLGVAHYTSGDSRLHVHRRAARQVMSLTFFSPGDVPPP